MANYASNDELMHYGVLGMKWGKRKAQPQTNTQKARAATSSKKLISQTERYAKQQSAGKNVVKHFLLGSGKTTTYNMARSMGYSRGKSAVRAILDLNASSIAGLAAGTGVNVAASKRNDGMQPTKGQRIASQVAQRGTDYGLDYALRKSGRAGSLQQRRMMKEYQSRNR